MAFGDQTPPSVPSSENKTHIHTVNSKSASVVWNCSLSLFKKDNLDDVPGILFVTHGEGIRQLVFQFFYALSS